MNPNYRGVVMKPKIDFEQFVNGASEKIHHALFSGGKPAMKECIHAQMEIIVMSAYAGLVWDNKPVGESSN